MKQLSKIGYEENRFLQSNNINSIYRYLTYTNFWVNEENVENNLQNSDFFQ